MKAVILVGGEGTRLRPLTCRTVKAMLPILNRPFLEHLFAYLRHNDVKDIILASCYLPGQIEGYFGDGSDFGIRLKYTVEESPLGTAGAVKNAEMHLDDAPFLVFNGDIFTDIDLKAMLSLHKQKGAKASIALTPVEDPSAYGVVETDNNGRVLRFIEKPPRETAPTNLINAGIYILNSEILGEIPAGVKFMFEHHLFPSLVEKDIPVYGFPSDEYWIDMGTPEKYLSLNHDLLSGRSPVHISDIERGQNTVHPTARMDGPVILGGNCRVGAEARIVGPTVVGSGCRILEGACVEGAVLWRDVGVGRGARLLNCIVGNSGCVGDGCDVPDGAVLADDVVMENGSKLGQGERIRPGTKIGPGSENT